MKTLLALLLLALPVVAAEAEKPVHVLVKIIQIGDGGARVEIGDIPKNVDAIVAEQRRKGFNVQPLDFWNSWGEAWLRGNFTGKADGDHARTYVVRDGTFQYTTINGAPRTLRAWKVVTP